MRPCGSTLDDADRLVEAEKIYRQALGLTPGASLEATDAACAEVLPRAELIRLRDVLASGSNGDVKGRRAWPPRWPPAAPPGASRRCARSSSPQRRAAQVADDQEGSPPSTPMPPHCSHARRSASPGSTRSAASCSSCDATLALVRLGNAVMQRYGEAKARRAALDFDDLVGKAASLLRCLRRGRMGALQARRRARPHPGRRGAGHEPDPVAGHPRAGGGVLLRPRRQRRAAHAVRRRRREAVDLQLPGRRAGDVRRARATSSRRAPSAAGLRWQRVPLTLSFRTVEPLLAAVDRIFAEPERTPGLTAAREPVSHVANRAGHAGPGRDLAAGSIRRPSRRSPGRRWRRRRLAVRRAAGRAHCRHHPRLAREPRDAAVEGAAHPRRRHSDPGAQARAVRAGHDLGAEGARHRRGRRRPPAC